MASTNSDNLFYDTRFDLDIKRYKVIKKIGQGAFGVVLKAQDLKNKKKEEYVAIKKIGNIFSNDQLAKRVVRELRLLRLINHENIINLSDISIPENLSTFNSVCIITECMDTDLQNVIHSRQPLGDKYITFFLWQLLKGIAFCHRMNIIHRDLKPTNLLLNKNCDLKICDLGLARVDVEINFNDLSPDICMTEHVVTRWYRAPEVILSWGQYTKAIDIWAVGCILAEMLNRKCLFPGKDYINQLELIVAALGNPSKEEMKLYENPDARNFMYSLPFSKGWDWKKKFPTCIDLLQKMLVFDPRERITAEEALNHPYLSHLSQHFEDLTLKTAHPVYFDFEDQVIDHCCHHLPFLELTLSELRSLIVGEIQHFHPEIVNISKHFSSLQL